jgi:hypothetical protein
MYLLYIYIYIYIYIHTYIYNIYDIGQLPFVLLRNMLIGKKYVYCKMFIAEKLF